tara:strand:- start:87 stop:314 length:228 start_codon:yes stop_codon:yes gene_type:complete
MIEVFKKDLDELEQFKHKIRNISPNDFDCEKVLDLLFPVINNKEKQILNISRKNLASKHFRKLGNLYEELIEETN